MIRLLKNLFRAPLYHKNEKGLLPSTVKKYKNKEARYVLRQAERWRTAKDRQMFSNVALGSISFVFLENLVLSATGGYSVMYEMAEALDMDFMLFVRMVYAAQIVLPTAGTGCYLFFESMKGKSVVNKLQKPAS